MPPKSKRRKNLEEAARRARQAKEPKLDQQQPADNPTVPVNAVSTELSANSLKQPTIQISDSDESYNPEKELISDPMLQLETFAENWVLLLDRENRISLALFQTFHFEKLFKFTQTSSASIMLCKSERTIRQWISEFVEAGGDISLETAR